MGGSCRHLWVKLKQVEASGLRCRWMQISNAFFFKIINIQHHKSKHSRIYINNSSFLIYFNHKIYCLLFHSLSKCINIQEYSITTKVKVNISRVISLPTFDFHVQFWNSILVFYTFQGSTWGILTWQPAVIKGSMPQLNCCPPWLTFTITCL